MNIWENTSWKNDKEINNLDRRKGLRLRFQKDVDKNIRRACIDFGNWIRIRYYFPVRVIIYFKSTPYIKASDGEFVSATFFEPFSKADEPFIKIATGDYHLMVREWGEDNALAAILGSIVHELTHYFQWISDSCLTDIGLERQASRYRKKIINEYAQTREHP